MIRVAESLRGYNTRTKREIWNGKGVSYPGAMRYTEDRVFPRVFVGRRRSVDCKLKISTGMARMGIGTEETGAKIESMDRHRYI